MNKWANDATEGKVGDGEGWRDVGGGSDRHVGGLAATVLVGRQLSYHIKKEKKNCHQACRGPRYQAVQE